MKRIGVVAFQGDFARHMEQLGRIDAEAVTVRTVSDLDSCHGVILPGGESTTIGMLLDRFGLLQALQDRIADGYPVLGTCAGAILLAETIENSTQPRIGGMDLRISRNAYGRQIASFEADVRLTDDEFARTAGESDSDAMHGVFIRAPKIVQIGRSVTTLATFESSPVLVRERHLLAATFHPELTDDTRLHRYFLDNVVAGS